MAPEELLSSLDSISELTKSSNSLDGLSLNGTPITLKKLSGFVDRGEGWQGVVYKLSVGNSDYAFKVYKDSDASYGDISMGTHYLYHQPFKDHSNYYIGSLKSKWVLEEYIPKTAKASKREGISWKEHAKAHGITMYDFGINNTAGADFSIGVDRGGHEFNLEDMDRRILRGVSWDKPRWSPRTPHFLVVRGVNRVSNLYSQRISNRHDRENLRLDDFLYYFNHHDARLRDESVGLLSRLSRKDAKIASRLIEERNSKTLKSQPQDSVN